MPRAFDPASDVSRVWHLIPAGDWKGVSSERFYYPETYEKDGFVHLSSLPQQLIDVGNHFYKKVGGDFIVLELDAERCVASGGRIKWEPPAAVGATKAHAEKPLFPHLYGGLPVDAVVREFAVVRDAEGTFYSLDKYDPPLKGIVFDCDGTLINSEPLWHIAEGEVFASVGMPFDAEKDGLLTTGLAIEEVAQFWKEKRGFDCSAKEVAEKIILRVTELIKDRGVPMDGVHESIAFAKKMFGDRIAIASSSATVIIMASLQAIGVEPDTFSCICSAQDEAFGKPHPAVYLTACAKLGVDPKNALALEDSENGMASALAAGMKVIALPVSIEEKFSPAHAILNSLKDFDANVLGALISPP